PFARRASGGGGSPLSRPPATSPGALVGAVAPPAAVWTAPQREARVIARDTTPETLDTRLAEAVERGQTLEVILVLRGKVRPVDGGGRGRIGVEGGRVATFAGDWVVAATPATPRPGPRRGGGFRAAA